MALFLSVRLDQIELAMPGFSLRHEEKFFSNLCLAILINENIESARIEQFFFRYNRNCYIKIGYREVKILICNPIRSIFDDEDAIFRTVFLAELLYTLVYIPAEAFLKNCIFFKKIPNLYEKYIYMNLVSLYVKF